MSGKGDHPRRSHQRDNMPVLPVGAAAQANGRRLRRYQVGAPPVVNHFLSVWGSKSCSRNICRLTTFARLCQPCASSC